MSFTSLPEDLNEGRTPSIRGGSGDGGFSDTGNGNRTRKDDPVFDALGSVDELQVSLGSARAHCRGSGERSHAISVQLESIQRQCITIAGAIASLSAEKEIDRNSIVDATAYLTSLLKNIENQIPPMTDFVLAGHDRCSAGIDTSRTVARRCERDLVRYLIDREEGSPILSWINVLSDVLFVLARYCEGRD